MQQMSTRALRQAFINYFKNNGHHEVPSASIVPVHDDTLLFTNAGMVPFKHHFLHPGKAPYKSAVSSQRCLRVGGKHNDLDNVGYTARHHTFFEMLGNFSFGAYEKRQAIEHALDFLTNVLSLDKRRLWVTVYQDDSETESIWLNQFKFPKDRLVRCGEKDNFWSMGAVGPCGPCTEIFYDHGEHVAGGPPGSIDEDGDRFVEIWNIVFMQFDKKEDGSMEPLDTLCVDTGMGLERIAAVMQSVANNYDVDVFKSIIQSINNLDPSREIDATACKVIADHMRSICWMIVEGITPSNEGRGYVCRRIIRRALRYAYKNHLALPCLYKLVDVIAEIYDHESLFKRNISTIKDVIKQEEEAFSQTLAQGMVHFSKLTIVEGLVKGEDAFKLYDTYGFPYDLVEDLAREQGMKVDQEGFENAMAQQRARSRKHQNFSADVQDWDIDLSTEFCGYDDNHAISHVVYLRNASDACEALALGDRASVVLEKTPFYAESGGQVGDKGDLVSSTGTFRVQDTQKKGNTIIHLGEVVSGSIKMGQEVKASVDPQRALTMANHSATHLLHAALRVVLGDHVVQKGSLVNADKLRFDFSHTQPISQADRDEIERIVNANIQACEDVLTAIMPFDQAKQEGVMALFTEKYEQSVRVLSMGDFSKELCGGTHVANTGHIGWFVITYEGAIAQGVRRIEAVTGRKALEYYHAQCVKLDVAARLLKCPTTHIEEKLVALQSDYLAIQKQLDTTQEQVLLMQIPALLQGVKRSEKGDYLVVSVNVQRSKDLRLMMDAVLSSRSNAIVVLLAELDAKRHLAIGVGKQMVSLVSAKTLWQKLPETLQAKGGGKPSFVQGSLGVSDLSIQDVLSTVEFVITDNM